MDEYISGDEARIYLDIGIVKSVSVEEIPGDDCAGWEWREQLIGCIADLRVYESERKHPGKQFINFENGSMRFTSGYGELSRDGEKIIFTTTRNLKNCF